MLATGVVPRRAALAGSDLPHVVSYANVLLQDDDPGECVAIVGAGGIGVDVAHFLSFGQANVDESARFLYEHGLAAPDDGALIVSGRKSVALMRRGATIGEGIGKTTRWAVVRALRAAGVDALANVEYEAIVPGGIRIRTVDGSARTIRGADRRDRRRSGAQRRIARADSRARHSLSRRRRRQRGERTQRGSRVRGRAARGLRACRRRCPTHNASARLADSRSSR